MRKALIIIADSNPVGLSHKMVLPTVKYLYVKSDIKYQVINPYREGFDPMISPDVSDDMLTRAYMHAIKSSDEIHIITNSHMAGVSPALEGFFERILRNDFAYSRDGRRRSSRMKSKDIYFYVTYSTKRFRYGPVWMRLKWIIGKLFKSSTIFQIYPEDVLKVGRTDYQRGLNTKIKKALNKYRS